MTPPFAGEGSSLYKFRLDENGGELFCFVKIFKGPSSTTCGKIIVDDGSGHNWSWEGTICEEACDAEARKLLCESLLSGSLER